MKKFNLAIPKPCHENWEQMTKEEKGRFCGSCQKTVIDFTGMSDRELANFFKKPVGSVCGRFQHDQLNRDIIVPKKSIPWLRHLIHIAWPTFILMLKSCNSKDKLTGSIVLNPSELSIEEGKEVSITMGAPVVPITETDSIRPSQVICNFGSVVEWSAPIEVMGDIAMLPIEAEEEKDTTSLVLPVEETTPDFIPLDTVTVTSSSMTSCSRITMGMVLNVKEDTTTKHSPNDVVKEAEKEVAIHAYPNPIRAGHMLNIKWAANKGIPLSVQLLTANGQRVLHKPLYEGKDNFITTISLSTNLPGGIYFVQAIYPDGTTIQSRVLVSR